MKALCNIALAAIAALLTGCASVGPAEKIPVTMPSGEKATIIAHKQSVPDYWLRIEGLQLNIIVKGDVTDEQLKAVAEAERACRIYTDTVRPNALVAVLSEGALYATAGGLGLGLGSHAFKGAVQSQYAKYGATASGFSGMANGVLNQGGKTYTFENCGSEVLGLFPGYKVRVLKKSPL